VEEREEQKKADFEKKRADHYKIDFAAIRRAQQEEDAEEERKEREAEAAANK
jgi:hypothetical protein